MTWCYLCYWLLLLGQWARDARSWLQSIGMHRRRRRRSTSCEPDKRFRPARHRRSGGRPKPPWVIEAVLRLYAEGGKSYRNVADEFNRFHVHKGMTVCLNTVYAWVQKYCSEMETVHRETRNRFPAYAPANLRWCLDGTGKVDALGVQHFILAIIDYGTRFNPVLARLEQANAQTILEHIAAAVDQFGKPRIIRTDNASVFRSAIFEEGLAALRIRHEFSEPGKPWQNGRIERLFLTLKQRLNRIMPENGAALDKLLAEFSCWYNTVRPHQHLHGFTPMEVWTGVDPYMTAPKSVTRFAGWDGMLRGFCMRR